MTKGDKAKDKKARPSKDRPSKKAASPPATGSSKLGAVALVASLVVLFALYAGAVAYLSAPSPGRKLVLDDLVDRVVGGKVATARFLDQDARITGTLKGSGRYWASYPRSDAATNDLLKTFLAADTKVEVAPQTGKAVVRFVAQFLLPLVILANLFALLFYATRSSGGGASDFLVFGRVGDKRLKKGTARATTSFANVAASEVAVAELSEVRDYLANPKAFEAMGALPPKGVLLVGPPGCGKTLLARAVAGEADAAFYSISGSEFVESLVGVGAARVRDLFRQARATTPAIIFIDELDGAGRQRGAGLGGGHDEREQTLNELLVQMDGFSPSEGVVVMGATNRPDILDPALLRAGRFDRRITVELPDAAGRLAILHLHAAGRRLRDPHADLPAIARRTPGFTGADLANVLNEAALLAVRAGADAVGTAQLDEAVERVVSGPRSAAKVIGPAEKRRIAVHEAGHAVVAAAMGRASALDRVSVVARGSGVGHLAMLAEDKAVFTRRDMEAQIAIAMAGIAAEELIFGEPSTGAEQDLERATGTARDMAGRFGMSERLGRSKLLHPAGEVFLGRDYLAGQDVSHTTLENLDAEVRRILDEQETAARSVLEANRDILDGLSDLLVTAETLAGPDLERALSGFHPHDTVVAAANGATTRARATRSRRTTK